MSPLRFYRQAYRAITDFGSYTELLEQPLQQTFLYILYLSAHTALACAVATAIYQLPWIYGGIRWAQENFPTLVIENGKLTIPEANSEPLVREYLGQSVWTYAFYPDVTEDAYKVRQPAVVFTPEKCLLLVDQELQLSLAWQDVVLRETIQREDWVELEQNLQRYFWPLAYSGFLMLYLVLKPMQAAIITFFSAVAAVRMGVRLPFSCHFTLCAYALTPAIAIDLLLQLSNLLEFSDFLPIYLATAIVYAYRATQHCLAPT